MSHSPETGSPGRAVVAMAALGAVGLLVGVLVGSVAFALVGAPLSIPSDAPSGQLLSTLAMYLGVAAVGGLYLLRYDLPLSYVRIGRPTLRDAGATVATVAVLLALAVALPVLIGRLGLPLTDHSITDSVRRDPTVALVFLPLSVLVVGPAEEFLYRGIIQTRLGSVFDTWSAVAVAAVIFAVVHFIAYLDPANVPGTIVTIFLLLLPLGAILGIVYEYTDNLVVPALAHGVYNAITFGLTYAEAVGGL